MKITKAMKGMKPGDKPDPGEGQEMRASHQTNLGPNPSPGGRQEPGGPVPPYAGRLESTTETHGEHMRKVMSGAGGEPGPGRIVSDTERSGVPATDTTAASPLGVGESISAQGNERALGASEEERKRDREEAGIKPAGKTGRERTNLRRHIRRH